MALSVDPKLIMRFSFEMKNNSKIPFHRQRDLTTVEAGEKEKRLRMLENRNIRASADHFWALFKFKTVRYGMSREQVKLDEAAPKRAHPLSGE
jgi:hypothetical protein